jgi:chromosome segregation ATPase
MASEISNGDLERLHSELTQAMSARNFYYREIRRLEKDLEAKRTAFGMADNTYRKLKSRIDSIEEPRVPAAPKDDDFPM